MQTRKSILVIFGTRPEAIKMASLIKCLKKNLEYFDTKVCVTAQHRSMLDQVLSIFEIQPDYDLDIMKSNQDLYDVTSNVLLGIRNILRDFNPDLVFVQGDTTTVMAASLSCYYEKISVAHIEAGLRTGNIYSPWPEEVNRKIATQIAKYHFAPTELSKQNLLNENIDKMNIVITGNTVIDALFDVRDNILNQDKIEKDILDSFSYNGINKIVTNKKHPFILVTGHRRENFGQGFVNICESLRMIAEKNPKYHIIYPVHLNPNVQQPVNALLDKVKNIHLIPPLDYLPFIYLMDRAYIILTDSGGVQEEAPSLGKPVLVLRDTTERPEGVTAGTVKLVGTNKDEIVRQTQILIDNSNVYKEMSNAINPYGDGKASVRIIDYLKEIFINDKT